MESKHKVIRDLFRSLCSEHSKVKHKVLAYKAIRISNDFYCNDVAPAHELAKGYTRPIHESLPFSLSASIRKSHVGLTAVRKLNKSFRNKAIRE